MSSLVFFLNTADISNFTPTFNQKVSLQLADAGLQCVTKLSAKVSEIQYLAGVGEGRLRLPLAIPKVDRKRNQSPVIIIKSQTSAKVVKCTLSTHRLLNDSR